MQEKIGEVLLDYSYYCGKDLYSDGIIENELLNTVQQYGEEDYNKVIADKKDWAFIYHLSNVRANIINWLPISKNDTVLEIGSGCGAITPSLSEMSKSVTCIELSKKRSQINAYRNNNRKNIKIIVGNFEDIEKSINTKFDYITLIGVFEYAAAYITGKDPYVNFLRIIRNHLEDDGKIILAIENKLGMKYWAGCQEDHVGQYFEGLEGYHNTNGVRTFSKKELEELINEAGFVKYEFYYPYPDYKLPKYIFSDKRLPKIGELSINLNLDRDRMILFNESLTYNSILSDGLFPEFSNSFLVILSK